MDQILAGAAADMRVARRIGPLLGPADGTQKLLKSRRVSSPHGPGGQHRQPEATKFVRVLALAGRTDLLEVLDSQDTLGGDIALTLALGLARGDGDTCSAALGQWWARPDDQQVVNGLGEILWPIYVEFGRSDVVKAHLDAHLQRLRQLGSSDHQLVFLTDWIRLAAACGLEQASILPVWKYALGLLRRSTRFEAGERAALLGVKLKDCARAIGLSGTDLEPLEQRLLRAADATWADGVPRAVWWFARSKPESPALLAHLLSDVADAIHDASSPDLVDAAALGDQLARGFSLALDVTPAFEHPKLACVVDALVSGVEQVGDVRTFRGLAWRLLSGLIGPDLPRAARIARQLTFNSFRLPDRLGDIVVDLVTALLSAAFPEPPSAAVNPWPRPVDSADLEQRLVDLPRSAVTGFGALVLADREADVDADSVARERLHAEFHGETLASGPHMHHDILASLAYREGWVVLSLLMADVLGARSELAAGHRWLSNLGRALSSQPGTAPTTQRYEESAHAWWSRRIEEGHARLRSRTPPHSPMFGSEHGPQLWPHSGFDALFREFLATPSPSDNERAADALTEASSMGPVRCRFLLLLFLRNVAIHRPTAQHANREAERRELARAVNALAERPAEGGRRSALGGVTFQAAEDGASVSPITQATSRVEVAAGRADPTDSHGAQPGPHRSSRSVHWSPDSPLPSRRPRPRPRPRPRRHRWPKRDQDDE